VSENVCVLDCQRNVEVALQRTLRAVVDFGCFGSCEKSSWGRDGHRSSEKCRPTVQAPIGGSQVTIPYCGSA